jgi:WD40 repeat protein
VTQQPRFWAFISYSHADERHARWVHGWLEGYHVPKKFIGTQSERHGFERPGRLRPIYRDSEEFSAGQGLGTQIKAELAESRSLIVICSPNAVASRWVNEEVKHFQSLGRGDRIYCLVVGGEPNALNGPDQCMPAALRSSQGEAGGDSLAADIRPGKDKLRIAALRLASGLLDIRFDELRQREQERRVRQLSIITGLALALLVVMGLLTWFALQQRDDARMQRTEAQSQTRNALEQKGIANKQKGIADQRRIEAEAATKRAVDSEAEANLKRQLALTAEALATKRQLEAEAAQRETRVQFEDATLRRLAAESRGMLDGSRAGGALMAVRVALAGLAIKSRSDQFSTLQMANAAGDVSLRAWDVPGETITAQALSPDGRLVVAATGTATSAHHLRFWSATGKDIGQAVGAAIPITDYVTSLAFSPDGRRVITAGSTGLVNQWDVATRLAVAPPTTQLQGQWIHSVTVSQAADRWLTGASGENNLMLWTPTSIGYVPRRMPGHTDTVTGMAFSSDGLRIASGSEDKTVRLWDATTGQPQGEPMRGHTDWVTSVAFSPDGQSVVSGSHDKTVRLWRVSAGAGAGAGAGATPELLRIENAGEGISRVVFSPDGQRVAAGAQDGFIRVWDARTGKALGSAMAGHRGRVRDIAFTPDGSRIISGGSDDGTVRLWDGYGAARGALVVDAYKSQVNSISFAMGTNSHHLAATDFDGTVRQWDADTGQSVGPLIQTPRYSLNAVIYSADGRRLVTASGDGVVRVWDAQTGRVALAPLRGHDVRSTAVASSRDDKLLASADDSGHVIVWDAANGQLLRRMSVLRDKVWSVGFSPDGKRLAASGAKGLFALWELATGRLIYEAPELGNSALPNLAFSPDGRYIATANRQRKTLNLWDGRTGRPIVRPFTGHGSAVEAVAFSPDGHFVASGSSDMTVRLWDLENGEPVGTPVTIGGLVSGLAFSADGQRLAASSNNKFTIHIWDGPGAWAKLHCQRLTRNMSREEWGRYVGKAWSYVKQCPNLPVSGTN